MSSLSVKARLFLTIGLLLALMATLGIVSLNGLRRSSTNLETVYKDRLLPIVWIDRIAANVRDNVIALDAALIAGDPASIAAFAENTRGLKEANDKLWEQYDRSSMAPGEEALASAYRQALLNFRVGRDQMANLLAAGQLDQARSQRGGMQASIVAFSKAGQELLDLQQRISADAATAAQHDYRFANVVAWSVMLLALGLGGGFGWLLVRSMMRSLDTAVAMSERIAEGHLGQSIAIASNDEFGRLLRALQTMEGRLSDIVGAVHAGAASVGAAARQISQGNDDLSQRTQQQAAALEETASSMEQMTATVRQNADNARVASSVAAGARDQADRGGIVVNQAVSAMSEINSSSRRIADIIAVIDEIAFQTNLLALNAAVEAARAGEQGRGFAVVATEVRSLAQRSASAAKEIKELIGDSVAKVAAGTQLVDQSGAVLNEIVVSIKKVADVVAEISAASEEQAGGIDQVNRAITQMDTVTQQNAALVEEASAASKGMEHQSQELVEKIGFFTIAGQRAQTSTQPAASRPVPQTRVKPAASAAKKSVRSAVSAHAPLAKASGGDSWQEF